MHWSDKSISRIVSSMNELKQTRSAKCNELITAAKTLGLPLTTSVQPSKVNGNVAAVDSGLATKQFVSLDVVILRGLSSIFTYKDNELISSTYFQNRVPEISVHYEIFTDQSESTSFKSL